LLALGSCIFTGPVIRGEGEVTKETRRIADFEKVEVSRGLEVFLIPDSQEYVVVEADANLHNVIRTKVDEETLEIYTDKLIRSAKSRKVHVHFVQLSEIKSTSGALVRSVGEVRSKQIEVSASSGSNQILEINAGDFEGSSSSGAHMSLRGKAQKAELSASSGGHINGDDFIAFNCRASASSGGHVRAGVKQVLDAKASSGGHIYYLGDPETTTIRSSSGGTVRKD
jgi:hypothetical protein